MIQIRNLDKKIQSKSILKDINVDIQKGKLTSLIGPNGAGKSTLLSAVSRLFEYQNGTINIENKLIDDYKSDELAKKLSILKQTNHTDMNITVEQLVNFGRFPYSKGRMKKEDHEKVAYAIDLLPVSYTHL